MPQLEAYGHQWGWRLVHYGMGDRKVCCQACGAAREYWGEPGSQERQHQWMAEHVFTCRSINA